MSDRANLLVWTLLAIQHTVWAMASRITIRPNQRWMRFMVSNEIPVSLMMGLLRPASRNKGIMLMTAMIPERLRSSPAPAEKLL